MLHYISQQRGNVAGFLSSQPTASLLIYRRRCTDPGNSDISLSLSLTNNLLGVFVLKYVGCCNTELETISWKSIFLKGKPISLVCLSSTYAYMFHSVKNAVYDHFKHVK